MAEFGTGGASTDLGGGDLAVQAGLMADQEAADKKAAADKVKAIAQRVKDAQAADSTLTARQAQTQAAQGLLASPAITKLLHRTPTEADLPALMQSYNALVPASQQVTDPKKIIGVLSAGINVGDQRAINAVELSGSVQTEITLQLGAQYGNKKVSIPADQLAAYKANFGTEATQLPTLAGLAFVNGVDLGTLVAAMAVNGGMTGAGIARNRAQGQEDGDIIASDQTMGEESAVDVAHKLKQFSDYYHDPTLALIATVNSALAAKLLAPDVAVGLTPEDRTALHSILNKANWSSKTMDALGVSYDPEKASFIESLSGGPSAANRANKVSLPDPAELKTSIDSLFRGWFQRNPTPEELSAFAEHINGSLTTLQMKGSSGSGGSGYNPLNPAFSKQGSAAPGVAFQPNPQAESEAALRATPEYQRLFGNRPGNMDEAQYVKQNQDEAAKTFGGQGLGETDAIRAGMTSGEYGTTGRYLEGTADAVNNSTFQGRLADMAKTVAAMT